MSGQKHNPITRDEPMTVKERILFAMGWFWFAIGVIGAFLPILPTVPFWLISAACWARSSPRMHSWLLSRPKVGPVIADWERYGMIRPRAKAFSITTMALMMSYPVFVRHIPYWAKVSIAVTGVSVSLFILTRPSRKPGAS